MHSNSRIAALVAKAEILSTMATEAAFNAAMDAVDAAITQEIGEIVAELQKANIPETSIARLQNLAARVSGIIEEGKPPGDDPAPKPPVEA